MGVTKQQKVKVKIFGLHVSANQISTKHSPTSGMIGVKIAIFAEMRDLVEVH